MDALPFHVVDVFTDRAFAGNPLAVVLDGDDLSTEAMQSLAREFNLSETAFPVRPSAAERDQGVDYRLRIFTPTHELPFAGHPSVGAAWVLASLGRFGPGTVRQACTAGVQSLRIEPGPGVVELTSPPPTVGAEIGAGAALAAAGLDGDDLAGHPVRLAGFGLAFAFVLVSEDATVGKAQPDVPAIRTLAEQGVGGVSVSHWDPDARTAHTRVFAGDIGISEDPATGSAALGFGAYLVTEGLLPSDGESRFVVLQGAEAGRPSRLDCAVVTRGGEVVECRLAGGVVPISSGEIVRP